AFGTRAGVEVAVRTKGEPGDVEQVAGEGAGLEVATDADDGDGGAFAARAADHREEVSFGIDGRVGDKVKLVCHGDGDVGVKDVRGEAVRSEGEVAGDGAFRDAEQGAVGADEIEVGRSVAECGGGKLGSVVGDGKQVGAGDLEAAAWNGSTRREVVKVRSLTGGGPVGM